MLKKSTQATFFCLFRTFLKVIDARDYKVDSISKYMDSGNRRIALSEITGNANLPVGICCIRLPGYQEVVGNCKVLYV
ncbi:MAG: hypothetical protein WCR01_06750 [Bacteroidota bacterium]